MQWEWREDERQERQCYRNLSVGCSISQLPLESSESIILKGMWNLMRYDSLRDVLLLFPIIGNLDWMEGGSECIDANTTPFPFLGKHAVLAKFCCSLLVQGSFL
jgi:hypothetical protein